MAIVENARFSGLDVAVYVEGAAVDLDGLEIRNTPIGVIGRNADIKSPGVIDHDVATEAHEHEPRTKNGRKR